MNKSKMRLILVWCLLALPAIGLASSSTALKRYEAGKYESALREYKRLLLDKPDDARLHFNAGTAAFRVNDFDEAEKQLSSALVTQDLQLQERTYYNLGNTEYRRGTEAREPDKKQAGWEQAIANYESALKLNPKDDDAKYNMEVVKKLLEELKKQQQNQQSKDDQKDQSKDDQSKQDQQSKKDQQSKDKEDKSKQQEQNKPDQQKPQPDQNQETKKPDEQQAQQKPDGSKDDKKEAESKKGKESKDKPENPEDQQAQAQKGVMARMTPEQAQQLLDAQKGDEKAMIFIPKLKTNRTDRVFKDW
jgi:Ca-activated chloride channel family protein